MAKKKKEAPKEPEFTREEIHARAQLLAHLVLNSGPYKKKKKVTKTDAGKSIA
ncbi:MAG: hypothetical protein OXL40_04820 [Bacteroidota bacterium]|nr:hypothetical protein [Bacteroidota bacterium]